MNDNLPVLREKANNLPMLPGVYIMLDNKNEVIYVGKAKKLKNRVSSYFHGDHLPKVAAMIEKISDFNVIVVNSEFEALMLENSLIKRHKPHYNILLKDDKGYPYVRLDLREEYPALRLAGKAVKDGARYFGPYGSRGSTNKIIESLNKAMMLPMCSRKFPGEIGKGRPCLNYHIGTCEGWCRGEETQEEYRRRIGQAVMILEGNSEQVLAELTEKMEKAAEELHFENAARLRDRKRAVENLANRQRVISTDFNSTDAIGFVREEFSCFTVMHYSEGNLIDKDVLLMDDPIEEDDEALSDFICRYYVSGRHVKPREILLPFEIGDCDSVEQFLSEDSRMKVSILVPKRGDKARLVDDAKMNAHEEVIRRTTELHRREKNLELLQKMLMLSTVPRRIEAFDVSNLGDTGIVAAMTVHVNGKPSKKDYRKFRIKDMPVRDDYASMHQAVYRRFRRCCDGDEKFSQLPDLLLIDGGAEHTAVAEKALKELGIDLPVFGMVKDDRHRTRALITANGREIGIQGTQSIFSLVGRIQEETHRFAIEYQRSLRNETVESSLTEIPGVGSKRSSELLKTFKSVKAIREAEIGKLAEVVPQNTAESIYNYYHKDNADESNHGQRQGTQTENP